MENAPVGADLLCPQYMGVGTPLGRPNSAPTSDGFGGPSNSHVFVGARFPVHKPDNGILAYVLAVPMATTSQTPMMKAGATTDNVRILRDYLAALDKKQGIPTEFLTKDLVFVFNGDKPTNTEGWQGLSKFWFGAFPGSKHTVEYAVSEGDRVFARLRAKGTHKGPFGPVRASGKPIDIFGAACFTFRDGKVARVEVLWDMLTCQQQIGALPTNP